MIRVLFAAANPADTPPLRLGEELREIRSKLRASSGFQDFDLRSIWAVRADDLLQEMNDFRPNILHLSGHGSREGLLALEDAQGYAAPVSPATLSALFANFSRWLNLVVLNACSSAQQAAAILDAIGVVVAMRASVGDEAALTFAASFYRGLGFGRSVRDAFDQGLISLRLQGIGEEDIPTLLHRDDIKPDRLTLAESLQRAAQKRRADDPIVPRRIEPSRTRSVVYRRPCAVGHIRSGCLHRCIRADSATSACYQETRC